MKINTNKREWVPPFSFLPAYLTIVSIYYKYEDIVSLIFISFIKEENIMEKLLIGNMTKKEVKALTRLVQQRNPELMKLVHCTHTTKNGQLATFKLSNGRFRCRHCGVILDIRMSQQHMTPRNGRIDVADRIQQSKAETIKIQKDSEHGYEIWVKLPKKMAELLQSRYNDEQIVDQVESLLQDARRISIPKWMDTVAGRLYGLDRNVPYVNMMIKIPHIFRRNVSCSDSQLANWTVRVLWSMLKDDQDVINDIYLGSENFMQHTKQSYHYRSVSVYKNITFEEWLANAVKTATAPKRLVKERSAAND
jgi:hypothetical protein